ncbi:hypothetical protein M427DRAFT_153276 [Gonapodya prolifera JEL478]|uniref:L domain-like protein n=1 Tax=Gonapodya prolifera (strain JEL478) TaxID=1344416 RepID=A0A139AP54_GONPJ|nr:hypothetical protein M427DRAFT_153276 [Gonapodya prolifera JEL478]|eukprot:KXS18537.1 hypothetical protein M427DRAFT_153276 [Gonapodya prolifera JEL478]
MKRKNSLIASVVSLMLLLALGGTNCLAQTCSASDPPTDCLNVDKYLVQMGFPSTNGCCCGGDAIDPGSGTVSTPINLISCDGKRVTTLSFTEPSTTPGSMPETFDLPELQRLILSNLSLSGAVPDISANKKLRQLILRNNKLTRFLYTNFSVNPDLANIIVSSNPISAPFPSSLLNVHYLYNLEIDNTDITGEFPDFSKNFNLVQLNTSCSGLTGNLDGRLPPSASTLAVTCFGQTSKVYYCNATTPQNRALSTVREPSIPAGTSAQCAGSPVSLSSTTVPSASGSPSVSASPNASGSKPGVSQKKAMAFNVLELFFIVFAALLLL